MGKIKSVGVNRDAIGEHQVKKSKYNNKKTMVGDLKFDSKKEADRWVELLSRQERGVINDLERQTRIPLKVNGVKVTTYVADFTYTMNGEYIVEDVKSEYTKKLPVYRLKSKLFEAINGFKITEVV